MTQPTITIYFNKNQLDLYKRIKELDTSGYANRSAWIIAAILEKLEFQGGLAERLLSEIKLMQAQIERTEPEPPAEQADDFFNQDIYGH